MKVLDGIELPHQLTKLLGSNLFKKEQIKLLKGVNLSTDQLGGLFVQAMDFLLASTKRNIESYPNATRQEKDAEIHRRDFLMNLLKKQMELL